MIAQEMCGPGNRGRIFWVLASSRPDLIEVDLKRPGRVDVKIPLFPTSTPAEGFALHRARWQSATASSSADADSRRLEPRMPLAAHPRRGGGAGGESSTAS